MQKYFRKSILSEEKGWHTFLGITVNKIINHKIYLSNIPTTHMKQRF